VYVNDAVRFIVNMFTIYMCICIHVWKNIDMCIQHVLALYDYVFMHGRKVKLISVICRYRWNLSIFLFPLIALNISWSFGFASSERIFYIGTFPGAKVAGS
jgi:hypothetical protein